jgi:hypothetical protein
VSELLRSLCPKIALVRGFLKRHKRSITFLAAFLVAAYSAFWLVHPDEFGRFYDIFGIVVNLLLIASQVFWIGRVRELGRKLIASKRWRQGLGTAALIVYFFLLANYLLTEEDTFKGSGLTLRAALLEAPFSLWLLGSVLGFLVAAALWIFARVAVAAGWLLKRLIARPTPELLSHGRRHFLKQTAVALSAAPFVAGLYGLFYGRLNLETTYQRIRLRQSAKSV